MMNRLGTAVKVTMSRARCSRLVPVLQLTKESSICQVSKIRHFASNSIVRDLDKESDGIKLDQYKAPSTSVDNTPSEFSSVNGKRACLEMAVNASLFFFF